MGESISFECGVEAEDVSGVDAWWLKDGVNLTVADTARKYDIQVPAPPPLLKFFSNQIFVCPNVKLKISGTVLFIGRRFTSTGT